MCPVPIFFVFLLSPILCASQEITASSYLLLEAQSLEVIDGKDYKRPLPPASTIKILTALVALERLRGDEMIVVPRKVLGLPHSRAGLVPGRAYKAIELIEATLIHSANDAAYTLAKRVAGSEEAFARLMMEKAASLGAKDTVIKNATGLNAEGQHTTCYDLALILKGALEHERLRNLLSMRSFSLRHGRKITYYENHNRLLFCFPPTVGGKTGYTRASRYTYVGAFEKGGRVYILSMLQSEDLWGDARVILSKVFDEVPTEGELRLAKAKVRVEYEAPKKRGKAAPRLASERKRIKKGVLRRHKGMDNGRPSGR
jgi:D-alanyl-D-alanine carboxypeptidase (penicillin-binding protein 5/6)